MNIAGCPEQHAALRSDRIAHCFEESSMTYGQLNRAANRLAPSWRSNHVFVASDGA